MDINKVWVSGLVVDRPVLTKLGHKTPFTNFTIQINEKFRDRNGIVQCKPNLIKVESLGKSAETTVRRVRPGSRFMVDGYLRSDIIDDIEYVRIRSFAVYPDESGDNTVYQEGLKRALEILSKSRDIDSAIEHIEEILEG